MFRAVYEKILMLTTGWNLHLFVIKVLKEASRLYAASWVRDIGPELRPNDYKKQGDAEPKKQAKETEKEPSVLEDLGMNLLWIIYLLSIIFVDNHIFSVVTAVAARGGMETLRPALHRVYMTRASNYKDALASFVKGYHEGVQQVMQSKEESQVPKDESSDNSKKTTWDFTLLAPESGFLRWMQSMYFC